MTSWEINAVQLSYIQVLWTEDWKLLRHNKALCKVSQLLYCKTQIFVRCSHVTSSINCPIFSPSTAIAAGRGFGPLWKHFWVPQHGLNGKNFYTESERLTVSCIVTGTWCERADLYVRHMILARKRIAYVTYEGRSEINASYFIMLAHDVRGEYCWYGSRGWTFPPIFR